MEILLRYLLQHTKPPYITSSELLHIFISYFTPTLRLFHTAVNMNSDASRCNVTVETDPVSTVPGYVVYHQTRDVSGQSLFS